MAIRYSKNGEIETYDEKTGKTVAAFAGEIPKKRNKEAYEKAMRENGLNPY